MTDWLASRSLTKAQWDRRLAGPQSVLHRQLDATGP
jgi:hypothetical protein